MKMYNLRSVQKKKKKMVTAKIVKKGQNQPEDHSTEDRDVGKERQKL